MKKLRQKLQGFSGIGKYFPANHKNKDLLRYFFSYFIIVSLLLGGFFLIVQNQLDRQYRDTVRREADQKISDAAAQLRGKFADLNQLHSILTQNVDVILSRYKSREYHLYELSLRMNEYTVSNSLLDSIVYADFESGRILSSGRHIYEKDGVLYIHAASHYLSFPLRDILQQNDTLNRRLFYLADTSDSQDSLLLYLPLDNFAASHSFFYILDQNELETLLQSFSSSGLRSIHLVAPDKTVVYGAADDAFSRALTRSPLEEGEHAVSDDETLLVRSGFPGGFYLAALSSNREILAIVAQAFRNTYLLLIVLGLFGLLLICLSMLLTYWPLHRLLVQLTGAPLPGKTYTEQIGDAFTNALSVRDALQEKLDHYRLSMQKSILGSFLPADNEQNQALTLELDALFDNAADNHIFLIRFAPAQTPSQGKLLLTYLKTSLPENSICSLMESAEKYSVFLLNYPGIEKNKDEVLRLMLLPYCQNADCTAAISDSASSPIDLPYLYENVVRAAARCAPENPVIAYAQIRDSFAGSPALAYPYQKLDSLGVCLRSADFAGARRIKGELFAQLDQAGSEQSHFPDFFIRCVLIDILTLFSSTMNRIGIRPKSYSETYFSVLYLCRSCPYAEKRGDISAQVDELLAIFEQEYESVSVHASQIRQIMESECCQPDFSIQLLADHFHVSIAYMSYLFKKKFEQNFSEYLWSLRLEKAKELLLHSSLPIYQVAAQVGYYNAGSFCRKFKQETGETPSQFREKG